MHALYFKYAPACAFEGSQHATPGKAGVSRQQWTHVNQFLALFILHVLYIVFMSTDDYYTTPVTPQGDLQDAATILFPHLSKSTLHKRVTSYTVEGRPDIMSFGYDLGGSTCACQLQWDARQYWQRVVYGTKYVCGHAITAFIGYILLHRWQWVILYKLFNEVLEELAMPVFGKWAGTDPLPDMEPRYDTIINDMLLAGIPFLCLGCHLVYVIDMDDPFPGHLSYDLTSAVQVTLAFSKYYILNNYNGVSNKFGGHVLTFAGTGVEIGRLFSYIVQIVVLFLIWEMQGLKRADFEKTVLCLGLIWIPFVFYSPDSPPHEQIGSALALALPGCVVSLYHYYYTDKNRYVLAVASVAYLAALAVYWSFEFSASPLVAPPEDEFYYKRKWCGLGGGGVTDSCVHMHRETE